MNFEFIKPELGVNLDFENVLAGDNIHGYIYMAPSTRYSRAVFYLYPLLYVGEEDKGGKVKCIDNPKTLTKVCEILGIDLNSSIEDIEDRLEIFIGEN